MWESSFSLKKLYFYLQLRKLMSLKIYQCYLQQLVWFMKLLRIERGVSGTVILYFWILVSSLSLLNFFYAMPQFTFGAIFYLHVPIISYRLAQHMTYDIAAVKKVGTCDFSFSFHISVLWPFNLVFQVLTAGNALNCSPLLVSYGYFLTGV